MFSYELMSPHVRLGVPHSHVQVPFFPECVAKGSRLTLGGLGVEPCS